MNTLCSVDIHEAHARWQKEGSDSLLCVHFVMGKLPAHWGYVLANGAREIADYLSHFELSNEVLAAVEDVLFQAGSEDVESFIQALKDIKPSWRVDAVRDGSFVFGNQPVLCLEGNTLLILLMLDDLRRRLEQGFNTATRVARLKTALKEAEVAVFTDDVTSARGALVAGSSVLLNHVELHKADWVHCMDLEQYELGTFDSVLLRPDKGVTLGHYEQLLAYLRVWNLALPRAFYVEFSGAETLLPRLRDFLDANDASQIELWCAGPSDPKALMKQLKNGASPDRWILDLRGEQNHMGHIKVHTVKSAILHPGKEWQWMSALARDCAFPRLPGFLNIRRYGKRRPSGDMIVNERIKASSNLVNDREFLTKSLRGDCETLLEPVFMGSHCTLMQDELADAAYAKVQKDFFGKNYTALEFPAAYLNGLEENFFNELI